MKILARSLILLFVLLSFTASAKNTNAEKRAKVITSWMEEKLNLNKEQLLAVEVLNLKYEEEIEQLTIEKDGFPCMQAVRDSLKRKETELKNVLTSHQLASYLEYKCELKEELKKYFKNL